MDFEDFKGRFNKFAKKVKEGAQELSENAKVVAALVYVQSASVFYDFKEKLFPSFETNVLDGNVAAVEEALKRNPGLATKILSDFDDLTPLHLAVGNRRTAVAELLLQYGANLDVEDRRGVTPLLLASSLGDLPTVKLLMSYNDPTLNRLVFGETTTAIASAAEHGHADVVEFLHAQGASLEIGPHGDTVLAKARQQVKYTSDAERKKGIETCVKYLERHIGEILNNVGKRNNVYTPLMQACRDGDEGLVQLILDNDTTGSINSRCAGDERAIPVHGNTDTKRVVHTALKECIYRKAELVPLLLKYGAKQDIDYEGDQTPLMVAVRFRKTDAIKQLLENDTSTINHLHVQKYSDGLSFKRIDFTHSALTYAVQSKDVDAVSQLLAAGAKTDLPTTRSPLQIAVAMGLTDIEFVLLKHEAGPQKKAKASPSPRAKKPRGGQ